MGKGKRFSALFVTVTLVLSFATAASAAPTSRAYTTSLLHGGGTQIKSFSNKGKTQIWVSKAFTTSKGAFYLKSDLHTLSIDGCHDPLYFVWVEEHTSKGWKTVLMKPNGGARGPLGYFGQVDRGDTNYYYYQGKDKNGDLVKHKLRVKNHATYDSEIRNGGVYRIKIMTMDHLTDATAAGVRVRGKMQDGTYMPCYESDSRDSTLTVEPK